MRIMFDGRGELESSGVGEEGVAAGGGRRAVGDAEVILGQSRSPSISNTQLAVGKGRREMADCCRSK